MSVMASGHEQAMRIAAQELSVQRVSALSAGLMPKAA
jgi:hypothetical protein